MCRYTARHQGGGHAPGGLGHHLHGAGLLVGEWEGTDKSGTWVSGCALWEFRAS